MIPWMRLAMVRSGSFISEIFANTKLSPSAALFGVPPCRSWRYSFIAAFSSSVNPLVFLPTEPTPLEFKRTTLEPEILEGLPNSVRQKEAWDRCGKGRTYRSSGLLRLK